MSVQPRLILLHKQKTSGRVRFLCFSAGVVAFSPLPALAALRDEGYSPRIQLHPTPAAPETPIPPAPPDGNSPQNPPPPPPGPPRDPNPPPAPPGAPPPRPPNFPSPRGAARAG